MDSIANLELSTIAALARQRPSRFVRAGEILFADGDGGSSLFGVLSGQIELRSGGVPVETIGPGSCFGVSALVEPDHRRSGTATALTDAVLLEMNREEFLFAMQELPMFGLDLLHDLEERLHQLRARISAA
jgi:CRP/FNR family cyclic AMP-dependent transcriptional regulator